MTQDMAGMETPYMELADREDFTAPKTGDAARKTLAMRIAHRNRLRAERLARLRADPPPAAEATQITSPGAGKATSLARISNPSMAKAAVQVKAALAADPNISANTDGSAAALENFLRVLSQSGAAASALSEPESPPLAPEPASVLPFQRPPETDANTAGAAARAVLLSEPRAAPLCDLHQLEGAGPGLIWALQRAGIACMAELAALESPELISRLGYLGRLIPTQAWIAMARARQGASHDNLNLNVFP